jgi:putative endonuclease
MKYRFWVYLMASKRNGTLYVGMTNGLPRRVFEHKEKLYSGFTAKYDVSILVWYEEHQYVNNAIQREKNIKHWPRAWKICLIEQLNPDWSDLDLHLI